MKTIFTLLISLLIAAVPVRAGDTTPKTHIYTVELTRTNPPVLDLIFLGDVTADKAEEYLRIQLAVAARYWTAGDIMAYAYRRSEEGEKSVYLKDGSTCLLFKKESGKVLTGKQANLIGQ